MDINRRNSAPIRCQFEKTTSHNWWGHRTGYRCGSAAGGDDRQYATYFRVGAGLSMRPGGFVFVGLTLLCFAFGYTALAGEIVSKGAFYTQVGQGLGRPAG